ncbi:DNA-binding protein [Antarcticirhabdus aurantiaca]|uniref:DNA-binding protein n=1 Tax=Antarcticirhabdus aurantiaca TaxID=2606717 RepID=UPI00131B2438|nr:DNA-binding protein [Antarcticirhabdus aurantiaca]
MPTKDEVIDAMRELEARREKPTITRILDLTGGSRADVSALRGEIEKSRAQDNAEGRDLSPEVRSALFQAGRIVSGQLEQIYAAAREVDLRRHSTTLALFEQARIEMEERIASLEEERSRLENERDDLAGQLRALATQMDEASSKSAAGEVVSDNIAGSAPLMSSQPPQDKDALESRVRVLELRLARLDAPAKDSGTAGVKQSPRHSDPDQIDLQEAINRLPPLQATTDVPLKDGPASATAADVATPISALQPSEIAMVEMNDRSEGEAADGCLNDGSLALDGRQTDSIEQAGDNEIANTKHPVPPVDDMISFLDEPSPHSGETSLHYSNRMPPSTWPPRRREYAEATGR